MRKIKLLFSAFLPVALICGTVQAQLSDRVNNPTTFKVGTRPIQGNFGASFSVGRSDIQGWFGIGENDDPTTRVFESLPLLTIKYYYTDNLVITAGIKGESTRKMFKGDVDPMLNTLGISSKNTKTVQSEYMIVPGVENHFMSSNILDVYFGARIPLGMVTDIDIANIDYENKNYTYNEQKRRSMLIGLDFGLGVQMFVADLPFALGAEAGLAGYGYLRNKTKHTDKFSVNGVSDEQEYYTVEGDDIKYSSLKSRTFELAPNFRFSLAYFFKK
jgi:hypothetical protein